MRTTVYTISFLMPLMYFFSLSGFHFLDIGLPPASPCDVDSDHAVYFYFNLSSFVQ